MTESDAVTRIDAAIRRIEEAINRRAEGHGLLRQRHDALRREVAQVIAQIDELAGKESN
ncbi:hypothetical protein [Sphingomonas mucosissima]|uniref:Uncharacterized protein n=1 Tax=Sphingomonas mucosissima TaxID=370959 RepID=A0A245ZG17_9SPHN|nr:hypothetical protein [Sphingomonas mucosissima]OWK28679.1 hypothetical protein SPMU_29420 [Sphingomonas mucosissima]